MTFWTRFAINTALAAATALLQGAAMTDTHKAKVAAFVQAGNDLLNNW